MAILAHHPGLCPQAVLDRVRRELADAHALLAGGAPDDAECVHEARRAITRARGGLRLIAPRLDRFRRRLDQTLREALHGLAGSRDADAARETCRRLAAHAPCPQTRGSLLRCARLIADDPARVLGATPERTFGPPCGHLDAAREAVLRFEREIALGADPPAALRRSYRACRRRWRTARALRTVGAMHAWRRRVRHLRTQLTLLRDGASGPGPLDRELRRLNRLAGVLGDHHDLALVLRAARALPSRHDRKRVRHAVRERERTLARRARKLGKRVFREHARAAAERLLAATA